MQPRLHKAYKRYALSHKSVIVKKSKIAQENKILKVQAEPKKNVYVSYSRKGIQNKNLVDSFDMDDDLGHMYGSW